MSIEEASAPSGRLLEIPSTCAPRSVVYGPTEAGGASVAWLARVLRCEPTQVLALAASVPPAEVAPLFVPYLAGERAPVWRADVRGTLLGLSVDDGAAELARAVVMGICLSEAHVLATAEEQLGRRAEKVRVAGRGASEPPWREARLAALGRPLEVLDEPDASALGAAMLAVAAANGVEPSSARSLGVAAQTLAPRGSERERARRRLDRYVRASDVSVGWADQT
jgi:xylulokinase